MFYKEFSSLSQWFVERSCQFILEKINLNPLSLQRREFEGKLIYPFWAIPFSNTKQQSILVANLTLG